jgi:hypothetical protein
MKLLLHAAGFALVGWYLICPPRRSPCGWAVKTLREALGRPGTCEKYAYDYGAPVSEWDQYEQHDTLAECNQSIGNTSDIACTCIASDDPRLKEK